MKLQFLPISALLFVLSVVCSIILWNTVVSSKPQRVTTVKNVIIPSPTIIKPQQKNSCENWFDKYKHIESTEAVTKGNFERVEQNIDSPEVKIILTNKSEEYYVSYASDVTQLKVVDSQEKVLSISQLKKGDSLKVIEKYSKLPNNKEDFSITIVKEKS